MKREDRREEDEAEAEETEEEEGAEEEREEELQRGIIYPRTQLCLKHCCLFFSFLPPFVFFKSRSYSVF